jgi:hypothetical protein
MNNVNSTQKRPTNRSIIPDFIELFHLREALLEQGSDELCHLSNLDRKVGDNPSDYPGL